MLTKSNCLPENNEIPGSRLFQGEKFASHDTCSVVVIKDWSDVVLQTDRYNAVRVFNDKAYNLIFLK